MLLIKNGRVMDPKTGLDQVCDLLVDQGKIVEMGPSLSHEGAQVIDASGKVVAPGWWTLTFTSGNQVRPTRKTSIQELWQQQQVVLRQSS